MLLRQNPKAGHVRYNWPNADLDRLPDTEEDAFGTDWNKRDTYPNPPPPLMASISDKSADGARDKEGSGVTRRRGTQTFLGVMTGVILASNGINQ